jgi:hypothetical protein
MRRPAALRGQRSRTLIAQVTARLVAEHGMSDWTAAKRKACRELGLSGEEGLPSNDEVEQELRNYNTLFRSTTHDATLRARRVTALEWMTRLSQWHPVLIGGVAEGWATSHSDVTLELEAEDAKAVELGLINAAIAYTSAASGSDEAVTLHIDHPETAIRLWIVSPHRRRHRSRRDDDVRMTVEQVRVALGANAGLDARTG